VTCFISALYNQQPLVTTYHLTLACLQGNDVHLRRRGNTAAIQRVKPPELDMYQDCVNPMFGPSRALLRRVFFLDPEKTKYIPVGFYPSRNYQPLVEIGSPKSIPLILTDQHVKTLAEHFPAQCEALCRDEFYKVLDGDLKMSLSSTYKSAVISLSKRSPRSLSTLNCLKYVIFHTYFS